MEFRYETRRLGTKLSELSSVKRQLCMGYGSLHYLSRTRTKALPFDAPCSIDFRQSRDNEAIVACNSSRITGGSGYKEEGTIRLELWKFSFGKYLVHFEDVG